MCVCVNLCVSVFVFCVYVIVYICVCMNVCVRMYAYIYIYISHVSYCMSTLNDLESCQCQPTFHIQYVIRNTIVSCVQFGSTSTGPGAYNVVCHGIRHKLFPSPSRNSHFEWLCRT